MNPRVELARKVRRILRQREAALGQWIEAFDEAELVSGVETEAMNRAVYESTTGDDLLDAMDWRKQADENLDQRAGEMLYMLAVADRAYEGQMVEAVQVFGASSIDPGVSD